MVLVKILLFGSHIKKEKEKKVVKKITKRDKKNYQKAIKSYPKT